MRMVDLRWINAEVPKFATEVAEWPMALYAGPGMRHAAYLACEDQYEESFARVGIHRPISVILMKYNHPGQDPMKPRRFLYRDTQFARIEHAMQWTQIYLSQNKSWQPMLI